MVSLFGVAGYFVLLSAPFLAAVQILVYIGAIAILITFAVMLTRSIARIKERYIRTLPSFIGSLALFLILLLGVTIPIFGAHRRARFPTMSRRRAIWGRRWLMKTATSCPFCWHRSC